MGFLIFYSLFDVSKTFLNETEEVQVVDIYERTETKFIDTATFHRIQKSNKCSCSQSRNEKDSRTKQEL